MRKILIIIVIILLIVFGYTAIVKGIQIGKFHISSIMEIDEQSKVLEGKTEELNSLIDIEYPKKMANLYDAGNKMNTAKDQYLYETNLSTDEQIQNALQVESYDIERLYVKLGVHARTEGVNLQFVLNQSASGTTDTKDLNFTVDGTYIGITNFIYAIEDDEELKFRIYNFKLIPYQNDILRGSFIVRDVRITSNSLNQDLTTQVQNNNSNATNSNNENVVKQ